mmetsp:Transcript_71613/g.165609  ORF Transcript_71613/g.165609 Transcript_71613/m.165609 type:complete len:129 (-) Transcript_71613:96-482(-)
MKFDVVVSKKTVSMDMSESAKFSEVMKALTSREGIQADKQVFLYGFKEIRMPPYENGQLVIYDGTDRVVSPDKTLKELQIDGSEPLVCGELQDEWLEDVKWGAFSHTIYEADYLNHREYIIFNAQRQN